MPDNASVFDQCTGALGIPILCSMLYSRGLETKLLPITMVLQVNYRLFRATYNLIKESNYLF
jgi:hypothetical protein